MDFLRKRSEKDKGKFFDKSIKKMHHHLITSSPHDFIPDFVPSPKNIT